MKLLRLIEMCLIETDGRVRVGEHLSDMCLIKNGWKQGYALSSLFFNCTVEYAIRSIQVNQDGLKLNGTDQLLVYAVRLGGSVHTIKKNTEALLVGSQGIGLEVNADETNCMVMSRNQNAGRSHSITIDNSSCGRAREFQYLRTT
jgi:hypothetical protein